MYKQYLRKSDGRYLILYWQKPTTVSLLENNLGVESSPINNELRWNPVLEEWVGVATQRQSRTFFPPDNFCPLCVTKEGEFITEIPLANYEVAVFQNKFPAFTANCVEPIKDDFYLNTSAQGECEVVVYSPDHQATLANLSILEIENLIEAWKDRFAELGAQEHVKYVYIFENKGREIGVTLPHPHGQIYAFPFIPPIPERELRAVEKHWVKYQECLFCKILEKETTHQERIVIENEAFLAFIPFYARWPYETHIYSKRHVSAITDFNFKECNLLARLLKGLLDCFDKLWQKPFPYIMLMHQRPTDGKNYDFYHFHIEFYPPYRTQDKLKYLAGVEAGCGVFLNDSQAEEKAKELRKNTSGENMV
ncbi:MAG: galactose-1-phosphate uridylyltransferase [Acidobacteria bacterium]|nr:galactose-1-phosphate uridylyltransferase [Acidobacteriota bacterium]